MKKKTLAWATKWPDGSYEIDTNWTEVEACKQILGQDAEIIRVEIREVKRK